MTKRNNVSPPAQGEDNALKGYTAQYTVAAELIIRALQNSNFEKVILKDVRAERVDDIQIVTTNFVDAYQVKWHTTQTSLTKSDLIGSNALLKQLVEGWQALKEVYPDKAITVHLYTTSYASTSNLSDIPTTKLPPRHLAEFIKAYWQPETIVQDTLDKWQPFAEALQKASGLTTDKFEQFRQQCKFDLNRRLPPEREEYNLSNTYYSDIRHLQGELLRIAGEQQGTITLTRQDIFDLANWTDRFQYKARHEFPAPKHYSPINDTVQSLEQVLESYNQGYLALTGSPGSGKSTLLTKTLRYRQGMRLLRYYCFVPNDSALFRGEAYNFLHDLVLSLKNEGIGYSVGDTIEALRINFEDQLQEIAALWKEKKIRTVILIDGLDHIKRESNPERSLLHELPLPDAVPEGCVFILGSQRLDQIDLNPRTIQHLEKNNAARTITMGRLSRSAIRDTVVQNLPKTTLSEENLVAIERLSTGHPLALNYILNRLNAAKEEEPNSILENLPEYDDTIEQEYKIYWRQLESDNELRELLALLSRMRGTLDVSLMSELASQETLRQLVSTAKHYFIEISGQKWRFFHNSFRQFILDETGRNAFGIDEKTTHRGYHTKLAQLAGQNTVPTVFQWERLYHTYHSGNYDQVLAISTQDYFRNQFFASRPSQLIIEDTSLVMRAAKERKDMLATIRVLLIESELNQRSDTLEEIDIFDLLFLVGKPEEAIKHVFHEGELLIDPEKALNFACELADAGYVEVANEIFAAAEPLDKFSGAEPITDIRREMSLLEAWIQAAVKFHPVHDIIDVINKMEVKDSDFLEEAPNKATENLRFELFVVLTDAVTKIRDTSEIEQLPLTLADYIDEKIIRQRIAYNLISSGAYTDQKDEFLTYLLQLNDEEKLNDAILLSVAGVLLKEKNDSEAAVRIFKTIPPPGRVVDEGSVSHNFNPFIRRLRYHRLNAALGAPIDPVQAVPDAEKDHQSGDVLIERMVIRMANLWGKAWKGDMLPPVLLANELMPALRLIEDRSDQELRLALSGNIKPYLEILIYTAAAHGEEALSELSNQFERRWQNDATSKYWSAPIRRKVALTLFKTGTAKQELVSRLETVEPSFSSQDDVREFLENCEEQIEAWVEASELEKAQIYIPLIIRSSFGLYHEKDSQIYYWMDWFKAILERYPELAAHDFHTVAQGIATASVYGRGSKATDAASSFLSSIAQYDPGLSDKLKEWFWNEGVLTFSTAVEAFLIASFKSDNVAIEIPCAILRRLYLPYVRYFEESVIEAFVSKLVKIDNNEHALAIIVQLITAIELEISPHLRGRWWAELDENLRNHPNVTYLLEPVTERLTRQKPVSNHTKGSVTLLDDTVIEEDDLIEQSKSPDRLIFILENIKKDSFYSWWKLVNFLLIELNEEQTKNLFQALKKHEKSGRDVSGLIKKLFDLGDTSHAEQYALQSLEQSKSHGWSYYYDGGSRIEPYKTLIKIDPKYHTQAFEQFTEDYLQGYRLYHLSGILEDLVEVFWEEAPLTELWAEIFEHFSQLREFTQPAIHIPDALKLNTPNNKSLANILMNHIFEAFAMPQPELREDAYKALLTLYSTLPEMHTQMITQIEGYFEQAKESPLLGMALIRGLIIADKSLSEKFRAQLEKFLTHDDMAIRIAARDILSFSGNKPSIHQKRLLPPVYTMTFPEFATMEDNLAGVIIEPGTILPETKDTLQLVGASKEALKIICHITKIPFRNLVERSAGLMRTVMPESDWNKQAEENLMIRCKALGTETAYRRPRALAALVALGYLVAELYDADKLSDDDLYLLFPCLSIHDSILSKTEPVSSNHSPAPLTISEDYMTRNREWLEQKPNLLNAPPVTNNEEVILGFITKAEVPKWEVPFEYIVGSICPPDLKEEDINHSPESIIPGTMMSFWWGASQYPKLPNLEIPLRRSMLIHGSSQRVEIGKTSWLAMNPLIARDLGWSLSKNGLFQWVNDDGNVMVESQWWRSGRMKRHAPADGIRSEGWIVKATPAGYKALCVLMFPATWACGVKKSYTEDHELKHSFWTNINHLPAK